MAMTTGWSPQYQAFSRNVNYEKLLPKPVPVDEGQWLQMTTVEPM